MQIITNQFQKELKQHGNEQFPFLVSYQKLSEYESGSFMWHWHPEIEITYVQKGTMCYKVNHMVYHLKEGDIVFNNSGALHSGTMENQKDCAYIPVTFDSRLIALDEKKPDFYELDITICLQSMWRLLLEHITYEPQASRENSLEYDRIKKILSYIEENYQNKITLNDIAGHIHLCESECTRLFKRHMNTTLFAFLQEYRIERSLEFLQDDQPVSAVADKAGFSDPNYYSKVFAKIKGCSPREYRNHRF